ncbi:TIGR01777 family oxidoreductase [Emticicia sp. BO119]|uniref:TIGR01777 family oxidoreductase n=1 Tax=Emticicia sp. BO119 TaxID=2757768 RepID=UPI0015F0C678|nr:TIGR01777 family oxidoreductase [Emticicia sp. BO119]MBA4852952.1 TIGR01777 family protein [Emticicia sp. BO119]
MNILITGGTGLIGKHLTQLLLSKGHHVSLLSRKKEATPNVKIYQWDIEKGIIDTDALKNIDYIIHLAGAGIADKRWTDKRKQEIIDSRIKPIKMLNQHLKEQKTRVKAFISASGIGFYGGDTGETRLDENSPAGDDFIATCTKIWEEETEKFTQAERTVSLRTGIVLSDDGGALPKLLQPIKLGIGSPLGSGKQWMSWIHIDDMCQLYLQAIEDFKMNGFYNAVAPAPVRNEEMTKIAAEILKRPLWTPNVPAFLLKMLFGELSVVVLGGNYVKNKRVSEELSFSYKFTSVETALKNLLK